MKVFFSNSHLFVLTTIVLAGAVCFPQTVLAVVDETMRIERTDAQGTYVTEFLTNVDFPNKGLNPAYVNMGDTIRVTNKGVSPGACQVFRVARSSESRTRVASERDSLTMTVLKDGVSVHSATIFSGTASAFNPQTDGNYTVRTTGTATCSVVEERWDCPGPEAFLFGSRAHAAPLGGGCTWVVEPGGNRTEVLTTSTSYDFVIPGVTFDTLPAVAGAAEPSDVCYGTPTAPTCAKKILWDTLAPVLRIWQINAETGQNVLTGQSAFNDTSGEFARSNLTGKSANIAIRHGGNTTAGSEFRAFTYAWRTGEWGTCQNRTQTRSIWCARNDGAAYPDSWCSGATAPPRSQSCIALPTNFYCGTWDGVPVYANTLWKKGTDIWKTPSNGNQRTGENGYLTMFASDYPADVVGNNNYRIYVGHARGGDSFSCIGVWDEANGGWKYSGIYKYADRRDGGGAAALGGQAWGGAPVPGCPAGQGTNGPDNFYQDGCVSNQCGDVSGDTQYQGYENDYRANDGSAVLQTGAANLWCVSNKVPGVTYEAGQETLANATDTFPNEIKNQGERFLAIVNNFMWGSRVARANHSPQGADPQGTHNLNLAYGVYAGGSSTVSSGEGYDIALESRNTSGQLVTRNTNASAFSIPSGSTITAKQTLYRKVSAACAIAGGGDFRQSAWVAIEKQDGSAVATGLLHDVHVDEFGEDLGGANFEFNTPTNALPAGQYAARFIGDVECNYRTSPEGLVEYNSKSGSAAYTINFEILPTAPASPWDGRPLATLSVHGEVNPDIGFVSASLAGKKATDSAYTNAPATIALSQSGAQANLQWSSASSPEGRVDSCEAIAMGKDAGGSYVTPITVTGWSGTGKPVSGTATISVTQDTKFYVTCVDNESSFSSTSAAVTITVPSSLPNLTASSVTPATATAGVAVKFSTNISNSGVGTANQPITALFQKANDSVGNGASDIGTATLTTNVPSGGSASGTRVYTFPAADAGTVKYVRACADKASAAGTGTIPESNETDNCGAWTAITVAVPPSSTDLTAGPITPTEATVGVNTTFYSTITNQGSGATGAGFTNLFRFDNDANHTNTPPADSTRTATMLALGANSSRVARVSYTFPSSAEGTIWYVSACADNDEDWMGTITESVETNNCGDWAQINVKGPPNTSLNVLRNPCVIGAGQTTCQSIVADGAEVNLSEGVGDFSRAAGVKVYIFDYKKPGGAGFTGVFFDSSVTPKGLTFSKLVNGVQLGTNTNPAIDLRAFLYSWEWTDTGACVEGSAQHIFSCVRSDGVVGAASDCNMQQRPESVEVCTEEPVEPACTASGTYYWSNGDINGTNCSAVSNDTIENVGGYVYITDSSGSNTGDLRLNCDSDGIWESNASCTVPVTPPPPPPATVNGACASPPNGGTYSSAPTSSCSSGTPSNISGSGPWTWTCYGSDTDSTSDDDSCSANKSAPVVNGACSTTKYQCTSGSAVNLGQNPTAPRYKWECQGSAGTTAAVCTTAGVSCTSIPDGWSWKNSTAVNSCLGGPEVSRSSLNDFEQLTYVDPFNEFASGGDTTGFITVTCVDGQLSPSDYSGGTSRGTCNFSCETGCSSGGL